MPAGLPADAVTLRLHSSWFIIYGLLLVALGVFAIVAPGVATLAVELTVGWLLLFGGVFGLIALFSSGRTAPGFAWNLLTSIAYILAGLALLARPMAGILTLTIILAAYLLAGGIVRVMLAVGYRRQIPTAWVWVMISGVVDIALALMIVSGLPGASAWVLGVLVGINLLVMGLAVVMAAFGARKLAGAG